MGVTATIAKEAQKAKAKATKVQKKAKEPKEEKRNLRKERTKASRRREMKRVNSTPWRSRPKLVGGQTLQEVGTGVQRPGKNKSRNHRVSPRTVEP